MQFMHYSPQPIHKIRSTPITQPKSHKPIGFWLSVGNAWKDWCTDAMFNLSNLTHEYEVTLADNANILYVRTVNELLEFSEKYAVVDDELYKILSPFSTYTIDWQQVADEYQGIVIAPYLYEVRLDRRVMWYYGWDIASGCIWDATAINSFQLTGVDVKIEVDK